MFKVRPVEAKYHWCRQTVSGILANQIYLGHTVHYRLTKMSYKSKKNIKHSEDEWFVVENTHEPQIFAGLLRCGECGWTLSSANAKDKGAFLPLHPIFCIWKERLHTSSHALQDFVCVCPRKATVLANGGKGE